MGESHATSDGMIHYGREGTLVLMATAASSMSDAAWQEFLEGSVAMEQRMGGPARLVFSYMPEGVPTAAQRRMSVETTQKSRLADRVAMLSDSVVTRAAFTAIQWLLGQQTDSKAFRPGEVNEALDWLALGHPFEIAAARTRAKALIRAAHAAAGIPLPR